MGWGRVKMEISIFDFIIFLQGRLNSSKTKADIMEHFVDLTQKQNPSPVQKLASHSASLPNSLPCPTCLYQLLLKDQDS